MTKNIAPATGKLGVLTPGLGAVASTFLAGVLLDLLPVRAVLILIGVSLTAIAVAAWQSGGMTVQRHPQNEPPLRSPTPDGKDEDWT